MIQWYYPVILALYACGSIAVFFIHLVFDGFAADTEGPLVGFAFAVIWPLLVIAGVMAIIFKLAADAVRGQQ
jgi:hypothetical protein